MSNDEQNLDLPPGLQDELKRVYGRDVPVPPEVDHATMFGAMVTIARSRWRRRTIRLAGAAAGVAAAAAIAVALFNPAYRSQQRQPQVALVQNDLNRDGKVDILDAYQLARNLRDASPAISHDVTGDGKTDQADVDAIAKSAVSVGGAS